MRCARRFLKFSQRQLRRAQRAQRRAMMAFAPRTVRCMPARLNRVPPATLQPASTTPLDVLDAGVAELGIAQPLATRRNHLLQD